jgi:hypothetical protein
MWTTVWGVLTNLPGIVSALAMIIDAIKAGADYVDVHIKLSKIDKAEGKAKHDKDTSQLESLLDPKPDSGNSACGANPSAP